MTLPETMSTNNNNDKKIRGRTPAGLTLWDLVRRNHTGDQNPYALNAIITMMAHVLLNATSATELAIWPMTVEGHFKRDCLKQKNNNRGNQGGNGNAPTKLHVIGRIGINPDSNVITGTFLLKNCYASVLFDTGANRSFVSTTFSSQIDITPTALHHFYDVELADGRIIGLNTIIWGCTLNLLNHPFNIDLIPVELGSFDAIIGMDCNWGNETRLNTISCTKTQKYLLKGCQIFLARVTKKKAEDKLEEKRLDMGTLLIGTFRNERVVRATERAFRQRLHKTQFLTLGSTDLVCQEEGWIISNVHRLSGIKKADNEESLSTPKDQNFI
ncbi:putative reverse transcriptase domain-containing protein [Tanacetum coccineum]